MTTHLDRRRFLKLGAAGLAALPALPGTGAKAATKVSTSAHIVIAGAGAAGLAAASRLAERLEGARITIIDARKEHYYQPGFTLVAGGLKPEGYVTSATRDYLPASVRWIEERVAEFDPEGNKVVTEGGQSVGYDALIVATGLQLDYGAVAGMEVDRIGRDGLGSVYAGPGAAAATWQAMSRFADQGGRGLFLRPNTEMKCAGAPLKYAFITDDYLRRRGNRSKAELVYAANNKALFSVPIVSEKVRMLFRDRAIQTRYDHVMTAIDLGAKVATFSTPTGPTEIGYDFINVVPPMRAPEAVRASPLPWQGGAWAADGWIEADKATLRHPRFPNVFAVGDVAGVPKGKTAASVKWQVPVAVDHLVAQLQGKTSDSVYTGYTSCPLITRLGRAMLVEFDYDNNLTPSFPGVIAPLEELWITWVMKTIALKPTYLAMLRGHA
ncbi:NAD(P)/FAD-dependent oxidoreductase [Magnetospirillum sp. UT-4]|uniref:NAD(P)/FAD-dependent oxidoreductase n=1 Tax=Magnetospirillum sp. UT-4 TaxID=2681467 RepID=UPI0013842FD0|nr:FAD/NAD(P)-binding oxidoreductase [Magnetospirillum sp. UT-4]CAA7616279.1 Oxidoreductase (Flavoprotein) [Magnetospirillum sp. UT-4]